MEKVVQVDWGDQPDLSDPPFMRESGVVASPHVAGGAGLGIEVEFE